MMDLIQTVRSLSQADMLSQTAMSHSMQTVQNPIQAVFILLMQAQAAWAAWVPEVWEVRK